VGRRVAAAWALIGFACQCFLAIQHHLDLVAGLQLAMIHYLVWGLAGYLVGSIAERFIEEAFRQRCLAAETEEVPSTMTNTSDAGNPSSARTDASAAPSS
jgi:hypothetical protein